VRLPHRDTTTRASGSKKMKKARKRDTHCLPRQGQYEDDRSAVVSHAASRYRLRRSLKRIPERRLPKRDILLTFSANRSKPREMKSREGSIPRVSDARGNANRLPPHYANTRAKSNIDEEASITRDTRGDGDRGACRVSKYQRVRDSASALRFSEIESLAETHRRFKADTRWGTFTFKRNGPAIARGAR